LKTTYHVIVHHAGRLHMRVEVLEHLVFSLYCFILFVAA